MRTSIKEGFVLWKKTSVFNVYNSPNTDSGLHLQNDIDVTISEKNEELIEQILLHSKNILQKNIIR